MNPRCFYVHLAPGGEVLIVRPYGSGKWLELRGSYDDPTDPESPFQQAIDAIPAPHVSGLFSRWTLPVTPDHPSYDYFRKLWETE